MKKGIQAFAHQYVARQSDEKEATLFCYTLHFLSNVDSCIVGEQKHIKSETLLLGREKSSGIHVGENYPTVSRKHAKITVENHDFTLIHLGKNPTIVNGIPVEEKWYLQDGDIIQLSKDGPKFKFLLPYKTSIPASHPPQTGFTALIQQISQKAIRPYQYAILTLLGLFVLTFSLIAVFWGEQLFQEPNEKQLANYQLPIESAQNIAKLLPEEHVYLVISQKITFQYPNGKEEAIDLASNPITGTGFLCNDGKFITARHVVQFWKYLKSQNSYKKNTENDFYTKINVLEQQGVDINADFLAVSPAGKRIQFSYKDAIFDNTSDLEGHNIVYEGRSSQIMHLNPQTDWLYIPTGSSSEIIYDKNQAISLEKGEKLYILGYSLGMYKQDFARNKIEPLYSESTVSQSGIVNGMISISDRNFERGNSGGPVFVRQNDQFVVIGIVSLAESSSLGSIVPISSVR